MILRDGGDKVRRQGDVNGGKFRGKKDMLAVKEEFRLTSRNLPDATSVRSELIFMHLDFHCAGLHVEHHMHLARVLRALHLIRTKLNETPVEERTHRGQLCVLK